MKLYPPTKQDQVLVKISELVTLRDNLAKNEQHLLAMSHKLSYAITGLKARQEKERNISDVVSLAISFFSPFSLLVNCFAKVLELKRVSSSTSPNLKQVLLSAEAMLFWGDIAYKICTTGVVQLPMGAIFKARHIWNLSKEEALEEAMKEYWKATLVFKRNYRHAIRDINLELSKL